MGQWTALDHWSNGLMPQCSANKKSPGGLFVPEPGALRLTLVSSADSEHFGGSLRTPFDAQQAVLQPQMACHEQAGKALARKLSPRVEW